MPARNTHDSYGSVAKLFHWVISLLIIGMLIVGTSFSFIDKGPFKMALYTAHKSTGLTILILMVLRLLWRWANPTPKLPDSVPSWQRKLAHLSHFLLYLCVILIILAGWIMSTAAGHPPNFWWMGHISLPLIPKSKQLASIASDFHTGLAWTLLVLIIIHVCGALKHHFIYKDNVLKRMAPCPHRDKNTV